MLTPDRYGHSFPDDLCHLEKFARHAVGSFGDPLLGFAFGLRRSPAMRAADALGFHHGLTAAIAPPPDETASN